MNNQLTCSRRYVYVPFGELIMSYFSNIVHQQHTVPATSAEGAGLGPKTDISHRTGIKGDRLVNQLFACRYGWL